jgi:putative copper resistance protein D
MILLELARFALYADLGVGFGVPAAAVLTRAHGRLATLRPLLTGALLTGLPLSIIGYLATVAEMAGTGLGNLDWQLAGDLAIGTASGWAFLARMTALGLAAAICVAAPRRVPWAGGASAVALATLAWSGHAAASEGSFALPRLTLDIIHLLAAGVWIGALVLFLALLWRPATTAHDSEAPFLRFAGVGSILVALLAATGLANLWFLAPPGNWGKLASTLYGQLLAAKLALFFGMLGLATLNRFVLVPRLFASGQRGGQKNARLRLWLSIVLELSASFAILATVSRLGLTDPSEY